MDQRSSDTCVVHAIGKCVYERCRLIDVILTENYAVAAVGQVWKNHENRKYPEKFDSEVISLKDDKPNGVTKNFMLVVKKVCNKDDYFLKKGQCNQFIIGLKVRNVDHCMRIQDDVEGIFCCINTWGAKDDPLPKIPMNQENIHIFSVQIILDDSQPMDSDVNPSPSFGYQSQGAMNGNMVKKRRASIVGKTGHVFIQSEEVLNTIYSRNNSNYSPPNLSKDTPTEEDGIKEGCDSSSSEKMDSGYSSIINGSQGNSADYSTPKDTPTEDDGIKEETHGSTTSDIIDGGYLSIRNGIQGNSTGSPSSVIGDSCSSSMSNVNGIAGSSSSVIADSCSSSTSNVNGIAEKPNGNAKKPAGNKRKLSSNDTPVETKKRKKGGTAKPSGKEKKPGKITKIYKISGVKGDTYYPCPDCRKSLKDIKGKKHQCPNCSIKLIVKNIKESYYIHIIIDGLGKLTAFQNHVEELIGKKISCEKAQDRILKYGKLKITHEKNMIQKLERA